MTIQALAAERRDFELWIKSLGYEPLVLTHFEEMMWNAWLARAERVTVKGAIMAARDAGSDLEDIRELAEEAFDQWEDNDLDDLEAKCDEAVEADKL